MSKTLVIAEPGCTHQGDLSTMLRLIDTAAECGADVFKNQWTSDAELMAKRRNAADYLPYYRWLQYPVEWHATCAERCKSRGLEYACSIYLPGDAAIVAPYVSILKISAFEQDDRELSKAARATKKRVLCSNGGDERKSPRWMEWLHCVSAYPAPLESMNLSVLRKLDGREYEEYEMYSGLSDHSRHVLTGAVAVGAGASIIEAHFRLEDTDPKNPDYRVAFNPREFSEYIRNIRTAETLMGSGEKKIQDCEREMLRYRVTA